MEPPLTATDDRSPRTDEIPVSYHRIREHLVFLHFPSPCRITELESWQFIFYLVFKELADFSSGSHVSEAAQALERDFEAKYRAFLRRSQPK